VGATAQNVNAFIPSVSYENSKRSFMSFESNRDLEVLRAIRALVKKECANYQRKGPFKTRNYCWMREKSNKGICVFFNQKDARCKYFEDAVLPLDDDLREDYSRKEERDGQEIEYRELDFGKEIGQFSGGFKTDLAEVTKFRSPLAEYRRAGILPRPAFHGLALAEQVENQ